MQSEVSLPLGSRDYDPRFHRNTRSGATENSAKPDVVSTRPTINISSALLLSWERFRSCCMASSSKPDALGMSSACVCHSPRYSKAAFDCSSMARCAAAGFDRYR